DGSWSCNRLPTNFAGLVVRVSHPAAQTTSFQASENPGPEEVSLASLSARTAEFRLPPATTIRGTVTELDGKPVAGAELFAVARLGANAERSNPTAAEPAEPRSVKTDAQGRYTFPWSDRGELTVLVFPPAGVPTQVQVDPRLPTITNDVQLK